MSDDFITDEKGTVWGADPTGRHPYRSMRPSGWTDRVTSDPRDPALESLDAAGGAMARGERGPEFDNRKSQRRIMVVLAGLVGLAVVAGLVLREREPSLTNAQANALRDISSQYSALRKIEYCFEGSASTVDITMSNRNGNTEQATNRENGQCISIGSVPSGQSLYFSTQNQGRSGSVSCRIMRDGRLIESARSDGVYVIATCSGSA